MIIANDIDKILKILPNFIRQKLENHPDLSDLVEIIIDLGRRPEARFSTKTEYLTTRIISYYDLFYCIKRVGNFSNDNRAGIEQTLHRISSIKNRNEQIIGLTCRVGRAIIGTISSIRDLLELSQSMLVLGKPGVGKTTIIREIARILADEMNKRVIIIDTSNEIAGDGNIPHPYIGKARRMQVSKTELQHQVMVEAVENHMPEVIIIDEIGTELEALAARTIAERGVQLVGTVHGNQLNNLMKNPVLSDLIGGIQSVTLGDEEARKRGTQKSILERKSFSTFEIAIEVHDRYTWIVHRNVDLAVDKILEGEASPTEKRILNIKHKTFISSLTSNDSKKISTQILNTNNWKSLKENFNNSNSISSSANSPQYESLTSIKRKINENRSFLLIYSYVAISKIQNIIHLFNLPIKLTKKIDEADVLINSYSNFYSNIKLLKIARIHKLNIYTLKNFTFIEISKIIRYVLSLKVSIFDVEWQKLAKEPDNKLEALEEVRLAIEKIVLPKQKIVEVLDRCPEIRTAQSELIYHYNLQSRSFGAEPQRRLRIYPRSIDN